MRCRYKYKSWFNVLISTHTKQLKTIIAQSLIEEADLYDNHLSLSPYLSKSNLTWKGRADCSNSKKWIAKDSCQNDWSSVENISVVDSVNELLDTEKKKEFF